MVARKKATGPPADGKPPKQGKPRKTTSASSSAAKRTPRKAATPKRASPIRKAVYEDTDPKVQRILDAAKLGKWDAKVERHMTSVIVTVAKGDEEITTTFTDGKLDLSAMPSYIVGDRRIGLKNVSAVLKQMSGEGPVRKERVARQPRPKRDVEKGEAAHRVMRIPFDIHEASDEEVLEALAGHRIEWRNNITQLYEDAKVLPLVYCPKCHRAPDKEANKTLCNRTQCGGLRYKKQKYLNLSWHPQRRVRVIHFASDGGGFRSVALDRIITVR